MLELVYISQANKRFSHQNLVDLLTTARTNNEKQGITGMLLYDGTAAFIQVIEGLEKDVENVFENISKDSRHGRIRVLWKNEIEARNFPDWQMGFQNIRELNLAELKGYSDFMQNSNVNAQPDNNVIFAKKLLRQFKQNKLA